MLSFEGKLPSTKFFKLDELFKLEEWLSKIFNKRVVIQKYAPHATNSKDLIQSYYSEKEKLIAEQILEKDIKNIQACKIFNHEFFLPLVSIYRLSNFNKIWMKNYKRLYLVYLLNNAF